jgi:hypothetical protein
MATKFPKFSQAPTRSSNAKNLYGITAHDLEAHDIGMTEENFIPENFTSPLRSFSNYFYGLQEFIPCCLAREILKMGR